MDNTEIFIQPTEPEEKPRKKQRAPMTEDRKAILLENLRKGREKYKQLAKEKKEKATEPDEPKKEIKYNPKADIDELKETLRELKEMLNKSKKEEKTEQKIEAKIESIINKNTIEEKPILQEEKQPIQQPTPPKPIQQPILKPTPPIPIPIPKKVIYSLFKTANW